MQHDQATNLEKLNRPLRNRVSPPATEEQRLGLEGAAGPGQALTCFFLIQLLELIMAGPQEGDWGRLG